MAEESLLWFGGLNQSTGSYSTSPSCREYSQIGLSCSLTSNSAGQPRREDPRGVPCMVGCCWEHPRETAPSLRASQWFLKATATQCGKSHYNSCSILLIFKLSAAILPTVLDKISVVQCKQNQAPGLWPKSPLSSASSAQKTNLKGHLVTIHLAQAGTLKSPFSFTASTLGSQFRTLSLHVFITLLLTNPRVNQTVPFLTHCRTQCVWKKPIIFSTDCKMRATKPKSFWRKEGYAVWIVKTLPATMHRSVHGAFSVLQSAPGQARILTQQESSVAHRWQRMGPGVHTPRPGLKAQLTAITPQRCPPANLLTKYFYYVFWKTERPKWIVIWFYGNPLKPKPVLARVLNQATVSFGNT